MAIDKLKSGALNLQDDVAVDTDTLFVDASADRVGIGTTTPSVDLDLQSTGGGTKVNVQTGGSGANVDLTDGSATSRIRHIGTILDFGADSNNTGVSDPRVRFRVGNTVQASINGHGGIAFGSDTAAANTLDDYEEGTWTPSYDTGFPGGNPEEVVQGAKYVKIGRLVHCILRLQARNDGTNMQLGGLPFVPNCDGGFGTIGHDSHTTRKERIFSGSSWIAWIFSGTSSSLANQYYSITYTTDS